MSWKFIGTCFDNQEFLIDDVNVWDHVWEPVKGARFANLGSRSNPISVPIYELSVNGVSFRFAAHELSNCVWGFYREL